MNLLILILFFGFIGAHSSLWVFYRRQYRFATYLFDLLPYYPQLSGGIGILVIGNLLLLSIHVWMKWAFLLFFIPVNIMQFKLFNDWKHAYKINNYEKLVHMLSSTDKIELISFEEYLNLNQKASIGKCRVILRHDVDVSLDRTKSMIEIDRSYQIPATYFFRDECEKYKFDDIIPIMEELKSDNLIDIGFHYSTLTKTGGDLNNAETNFINELYGFKKYVEIRFIAAHGDKYGNRRLITENIIDLDKLNLFSTYDINYDYYLSEAGGLHHFKRENKKVTLNDQLKIFENPPPNKVIQILIHPDWWF